MAEGISYADVLFPQTRTPEVWQDRLGLEGLEGQHGLPTGLLTSVLQAESAGDPQAVSRAGARGLFQFMPQTAQSYAIDPHNPQEAAPAAAKELATLYQRYGDIPTTLAAWNWGSGNLDKQGLQRAPAETQGFIQRVTGLMSTRQAEAAAPGKSYAQELFGTTPQQQPPGAAPMGVPTPVTPAASGADQGAFPRVVPHADPSQPATLDYGTGPSGTGAPPPAADHFLDAPLPIEKTSSPDEADASRQTIQWLPGFEFMSLLPEAAQRKVVEAVPGLVKTGVATAINVGGAVGGAALGGMTSPVTGPVGPVVGEAVGSLAAHKVNQAFGLEPGDPLKLDTTLWPPSGDVLAAGIPLAARAAGALAAPIARRLPGASAALHEEAAQTLQQLPERYAPARPSAELYADLAAGANPAIPAANLTLRAQDLIGQELRLQPSLRNGSILHVAQDLHDLARQYRGNIPLDALYEHQQRLGLLLRQANAENWPQESGLRRLYGAIYNDIDSAVAAGVPEAATLRQATQAARREFAQEDLTAMFQPGQPGISTRPDGLVQINGGKLLDRFQRMMRTDDVFAQSFTPAERAEVLDLLHGMTQLPRLAPPRGAMYGSGALLGRSGLVYGAVNYLTGDPTAAALAAGLAGAAPSIIARGLMSPQGRALLHQFINGGQAIGPGELAALRSVVQDTPTSEEPAPTATPPYQAPNMGAPVWRQGAGSR